MVIYDSTRKLIQWLFLFHQWEKWGLERIRSLRHIAGKWWSEGGIHILADEVPKPSFLVFYAFLHRRHQSAFLNDASVLAEWAMLSLSSKSQCFKLTHHLEACASAWLAPLSSSWTGAEGAATVWISPAEARVGLTLEVKCYPPLQFTGQNLVTWPHPARKCPSFHVPRK